MSSQIFLAGLCHNVPQWLPAYCVLWRNWAQHKGIWYACDHWGESAYSLQVPVRSFLSGKLQSESCFWSNFADKPHDCQDLPCCAGCWKPGVQEEVGQDGGVQRAADCGRRERRHSFGEEPKEDSIDCRTGFRDLGSISHASCWVWLCWFCWVWTTTCLLILIFRTGILLLAFMFGSVPQSANMWKWVNIDMKRIIPCTCNDITIYISSSTQLSLFSCHD